MVARQFYPHMISYYSPLNKASANQMLTWYYDTPNYSGSKNPKWRDQVSRGVDATTSLSASKLKVEFNTSETRVGYRKKGDPNAPILEGWVRGIPAVATLPSVIPSSDPKVKEVLDRTAMKFVSKVNSELSAAKGITVVAEMRESIEMLKHPFRTFVSEGPKAYKAWLRAITLRNPSKSMGAKKAADLKKAAADAWLEVNFGWIPLFNDCEDILVSLRKAGERTERVEISARRSDKGRTVRSFTDSSYGYVSFRNIFSTEYQIKCNIYGSVIHSVKNSLVSNYLGKLGFRADEVAPAVWEAIPWSFLIDYFTNIGSIIECASFTQSNLAWSARSLRTSGISTSCSKVDEQGTKAIASSLGYDVVYVEQNGVLNNVLSYESILRAPYTVSVPAFYWELPSAKQLANLVALFTPGNEDRKPRTPPQKRRR